MKRCAKVECVFTIKYFRTKFRHRYLSGSPKRFSEADTIKVFLHIYKEIKFLMFILWEFEFCFYSQDHVKMLRILNNKAFHEDNNWFLKLHDCTFNYYKEKIS